MADPMMPPEAPSDGTIPPPVTPTAQVPVDPATGAVAPPEGTPPVPAGDEAEPVDGPQEEGAPGSGQVGRQLATDAARKQLGVSSVVGGGNEDGPTVGPGQDPDKNEVGFDSPGFVRYCLAQAGITAPDSSTDQSEMGPRVLVSEAIPGDLIAFNEGDDIAILVDPGTVIQAPDAGGAVEKQEVDDLDEAWGVSLESQYEN